MECLRSKVESWSSDKEFLEQRSKLILVDNKLKNYATRLKAFYTEWRWTSMEYCDELQTGSGVESNKIIRSHKQNRSRDGYCKKRSGV